jgi:effector-binding domain-containing protein
MLTLPKIVERAELHYVAVAEKVTLPFGPMIDGAMGEAAGWLEQNGVEEFGPAIFKYNLIDMPRLEIEFGFLVQSAPAAHGRVTAGVLPAGRYVTVKYFGHYDDLESVTAVVIGWAKQKGIEWDSTGGPDGERFVARYEVYYNGPMDEPDPAKWETDIFIKVRD